MKVLAIDASTKSTGIAIFENTNLIYYGNIISNKGYFIDRIKQMRQKILSIYKEYQPDNVVMEDILPQDVKHNQTVFKTLIYLQASIVISLYLENKQNVQLCTASHWRKLCNIKTGRGIVRQTLKKASIDFVKQKYNINVNDDISDAICLGYAYVMQHGSAF